MNATPERLTEILAVLVTVPELPQRLGEASRAGVVRYQSIPALAEVRDQIYRFVWRRAPLHLETTTHFDPRRGTRSMAEDPSLAEFWPAPVLDLMPQIEAAISRLREA